MALEKNYDNIISWAVLIVVATALTAKKVIQTLDKRGEFKQKFLPFALAEQKISGIHPDATISQAAHESGWGGSELNKTAFNYFGITPGESWAKWKRGETKEDPTPAWSSLGKPYVVRPTNEHVNLPPEKIKFFEIPGDIISKTADGKGGSNLKVNRAFRQYANIGESVRDWGNKISTMPVYANAYQFAKSGDIPNFAAAVGKAGYGSDPNYISSLSKVVQVVKGIILPSGGSPYSPPGATV